MWLDRYFAKKHNRAEAIFALDAASSYYNFEFNDGKMTLYVPLIVFESSEMSGYEHAAAITRFSVIAKENDRLNYYKTTNQKTDWDESYLRTVGHLVKEPEVLTNIVLQYALDEEAIKAMPEKNKKEVEPFLRPLTKEEERYATLYLLQPYLKAYEKELEDVFEFCERNVYYIGEDEYYNEFKQDMVRMHKAQDEFLEEKVKGEDKIELFIKMINKQLDLQAKEAEEEVNYEN